MKILRCGDPHAKIGNLEEMRSLVLFVAQKAKELQVDRIEILGDLYHTHAVLRLEVVDFWNWALDLLSKVCETVIVHGNHDASGDHSFNFSALTVFRLMNKPNLIVIDKPRQIGIFGYVPYIHDTNEFINAATLLGSSDAKVLVCHQTIEGSKYDSGIYAPDGVQPGAWSEKFAHIISGHIHTEQKFGNFIYPGTARWDTNADANRRKGIWMFNHDDSTGQILSTDFISTEEVCSPIKSIEWREGCPEPEQWSTTARVALELIGTSAWVAAQKKRFVGMCSIKTKITDKKATTNRKSGNNLEHFISNLFVSTMDKESLLKYAKELGLV